MDLVDTLYFRGHLLGTVNLVRFKVIFRSFGALFSKWLVTQQQLVLKVKRMTFETHKH